MPDQETAATTVYRLSGEAFSLAQKLVDGDAKAAELEPPARALNERLTELWPKVQEASAFDPGLSRAWSDARLDVGYVLSAGTLQGTSTRLMQYRENI